MRLLNYNKKQKKYKHITYAERTMIETWYNSNYFFLLILQYLL